MFPGSSLNCELQGAVWQRYLELGVPRSADPGNAGHTRWRGARGDPTHRPILLGSLFL
jgi:hypothetical protein